MSRWARSAHSVAEWFGDFYRRIGFEGCSSHSGRRTFITRVARNISRAEGSARDAQRIAGHTSMATTQIYIEEDSDALRLVVDMI
jgi:integrase/recombinase XerD